MPDIFLDESGQFSRHAPGDYFLVATLAVVDSEQSAKRFRSWYRTKFPGKMRNQSEIKFSSTGISDDLRIRTIAFIASLGITIRFTYLRRENIPHYFWRGDKFLGGLLYMIIVGNVLEKHLPADDGNLHAFCDNRHLAGDVTKKQFVEELEARLYAKMPAGSSVAVEMRDSVSNVNVQMADWIAGALAAYLEGKSGGERYWELLNHHVQGDDNEMFRQ